MDEFRQRIEAILEELLPKATLEQLRDITHALSLAAHGEMKITLTLLHTEIVEALRVIEGVNHADAARKDTG